MPLTLDFSDVKGFDPLPDGHYPVEVIEVELRESQSSEFPYLNWKLRVTDGEHADRFLWMMTSTSPKALWRLKETFDNLGIIQDQVTLEVDEDTGYVTEPELVGLTAIAPVRTEVYAGQERNRVDNLLPDKDAPAAEVEDGPKRRKLR